MEGRSVLKKIILTGLFAAMAVILSGIHFPVGPTKCFPFQHTINAVCGVLLGPWYASFAAIIAGVIRNMWGTGTIPGCILGFLVLRILRKTEVFKFAEIK